MTETVLVTGGAGFIGSAIAKRLVNNGKSVIIADNLSTGKIENIPKESTFLHLDLGHPEDVRKLSEYDFDAIMHLAGQSSGEASFLDPEYDFNSHVTSTFQLLLLCKRKNISRFIYASSMGVYGDPESNPVTESSRLLPKSYYGAAKCCAENYLRLYRGFALNITSFRMFNVYGPNQNLENIRQGMLSIYISYILKNEPILVKGGKDRFRDFIFIDDVVEAWMEALDNPHTYGKTYNLGTGIKTRVEDVINGLRNAFAKPDYPVIYQEGIPGDQFGLYADITLLKQDVKWSPKFLFAEGLEKTVEHENNQVNK